GEVRSPMTAFELDRRAINSAFRNPHSALVFHLYFLTISGTFSGDTLSRKSSSTSTGVANPQAPRHSTSITVHLPSGLVAPSCLRVLPTKTERYSSVPGCGVGCALTLIDPPHP